MLYHVILYYNYSFIILNYFILYHINLYNIISYHFISYHIILYYIILHYITLYYIILYYIILYTYPITRGLYTCAQHGDVILTPRFFSHLSSCANVSHLQTPQLRHPLKSSTRLAF